ncbi:hypothetical protein L208DRAFT_1388402 [Tricholoma matsutake]|nr:hypothetical protein L208DRAFT_1388402 [Tricholoma matsutake 945]
MPHGEHVELPLLWNGRPADDHITNLPSATSDWHSSIDPFTVEPAGHNLSYYPLGFIIFLLWAAFTAALIVLLELSTAAAPTSVNQKWYYSWLPTVMLTVFAQGHVPVTAMYIARLAMSALHMPKYAPASWAELFWQANRNWQGPLGVLMMIFGKIKMRAPLSSSIIIFATTCIIATITPVLLSRAYPLTTIDVAVTSMRELSVFWPARMLNFELYAQLAVGGGAWATGMSVLSVYNSSVFIPAGSTRSDAKVNDIFFTGDTQGGDATLLGVRTQGKCQPINSGTVDYKAFSSQMCNQLDSLTMENASSIPTTIHQWYTVGSIGWCSTRVTFGGSLMRQNESSTYASALIWLNMTDKANPVQGVIMCNVTFSTGSAQLDGRQRTFVKFQHVPLYDPGKAEGGEPLAHPLNVALHALDQSDHYVLFGGAGITSMLGYNTTMDSNGSVAWVPPSLDVAADRLWQGTVHMGSAIGLLSRQGGQAYPVTAHVPVAGRVKDNALAGVAWALVAGWLLLLLGCTVAFFTPTFGDSLNAYVVARLLVDYPSLVDGHCCGSLDDNIELRAQFDPVGDSKVKEVVGHITSGGEGVLNKKRKYAATSSTGAMELLRL